MKYSNAFSGIYPAVLTPFKANLDIDFKAFEKLVEHLYASGAAGIFVGGNMGEWYTQTLEERKQVAELAVKLSKGLGKVILHVGNFRTQDAIDLARFGEKIGVDGIASLPPYYARLQERDVVYYYRQVAEATSLPFFLYHFPMLTGYQIGKETMEMMATLPNMAGVKFTDHELLNLTNLIEFENKGLCVMNGQDQVLFPSLSMGASGGIGSFYNIIPRAFVSLYQDTRNGNMEAARQLQQEIKLFVTTVKQFPLIPAFKHILQLNGIGSGHYRIAVVPLSDNVKDKLEHYLNESDFYHTWKINQSSIVSDSNNRDK